MSDQDLYIGVEKIFQKDNRTLSIQWTDGLYQEFILSDLQKRCTCIECYDREKRSSLIDSKTIPDDLSAKRIYSIGRYALKVEFCSGCSSGIYTFAFLRGFYL